MNDTPLDTGITLASLGTLFRLIARRRHWIALFALVAALLGTGVGWKCYQPQYVMSTALVAGYDLGDATTVVQGEKLSSAQLQDITLSFAALLQTKQAQSLVTAKLGSDWDSTHYDDYIAVEVPDRSSLIQFTFRYDNPDDVVRMAHAVRETAMELGKPIWGDHYLHWVDRYGSPQTESQLSQATSIAIGGAIGLWVGAMLGAAFAWLLGIVDDRIWDCGDPSLTARLPLLCVLPSDQHERPWRRRPQNSAANRWNPKTLLTRFCKDSKGALPLWRGFGARSLEKETARLPQTYTRHIELLAAQIIKRKSEHGVKGVLLVEPLRNCGASMVVVQLAASLSRSAFNVLLIECYGAYTRPRYRLGLARSASEAAAPPTAEPNAAISCASAAIWPPTDDRIQPIRHADGASFDFLPADPHLESQPIADRLKAATALYNAHMQFYDFVLFSAPPLLSNGETALLASKADATIVVFRCRASTYRQFDFTFAKLEEAGATAIGSVWNSANGREQST